MWSESSMGGPYIVLLRTATVRRKERHTPWIHKSHADPATSVGNRSFQRARLKPGEATNRSLKYERKKRWRLVACCHHVDQYQIFVHVSYSIVFYGLPSYYMPVIKQGEKDKSYITISGWSMLLSLQKIQLMNHMGTESAFDITYTKCTRRHPPPS